MPQLSHIAQIQRAPKTKPAISRLSIAGLILSVAVWIVWLLDTYTPRPVAERCQTQECWDGLANGTINLTPAPTLPQILGWFVTPMLLTAIGLAIAGMIRSTKRPVPIIALAVSLGTILLMILPSLLMLFGLSIYGVMGASGAFG